ncbi:hypothetical protein GIY62_06055 [Burkholderia plantarii]|nr:hypothetical protein GIY62_06055 [Burkholderia plantarii]
MTTVQSAVTAEGQIANDIVSLLKRQRHENVDQLLEESRAQLLAIYEGKGQKVAAVCQIGLGLAALGLGDHAEAARLTRNAAYIAKADDFVALNAVCAISNMGFFDESHALALQIEGRFAGNPSVLARVNSVFEDTLDFAAAAQSVAMRIRAGDDSVPRQALEQRQAFMEDLAGRAKQLEYSAEDLRALATHAVQCIQNKGRKVFWTQLRGNRVSSVSLELYIDATPSACAEMNFDVAEALYDKFGNRTGADLLPISIRSHVGRMADDAEADMRVPA